MHPERLVKDLFFIPFFLIISMGAKSQAISERIDAPMLLATELPVQQTSIAEAAHVIPVQDGDAIVSVNAVLSPPSCTVNMLPVNGSVVNTSPVIFRWSAVPTADRYTFYLGTNNPPSPADSILDVTDTSLIRVGLEGNTTYYWYVTPKNTDGSSPGCETSFSSFTTGSGAANDHCDYPGILTVTNGYCGNPLLGTLAFADTTAGLGAPGCQLTGRRIDVWYQVTIPATGNLTIQTSAVDPNVTDLVLQAYTGTCGSLVSVGCNDDGNPAPTLPSALHAKLGLTGRTPGQLIFIRVTPYGLPDAGEFAICAFDTTSSVLPPVATGTPGNCIEAVPVNIGTAYKYTWATLVDVNGHIIAQVYPNGNNLGITTASLYINDDAVRTTGTVYYLDRNISLQPQTQPTSEVITRVYFKDEELQALGAVNGGVLRSELNATRTLQTCAASATAATCGGVYTNQNLSSNYLGDHFAEYRSTSLSTLYLHKGTTAITGANTWTGLVNELWENAGNWSCGRVPDINTDVIINSGTVTINSAAICRRINAGPAANITVTPGFSLRVTQ